MQILIFYKNEDYTNPFNLEFKTELWNKFYPVIVFWYPNDTIELV